MSFRRARSNRRSTRTTRKSRVAPKKVSKAVKSYVKKTISSRSENKVFIDYGANQALTTCSGSSTPIFRSLLPAINQNSNHAGRVGNEITIKSGVIKGFVNLRPYNATTNPLPCPVFIKMWLCSAKKINGKDLSLTSIGTNFFELSGSTTSFQGNMLDMVLSPNKEYWTIYRTKTVELGATSVTATGPVTSGGYYDNSKMSAPFSFSFGKHVKKIKYDDNADTPVNRNMYLILQAVCADGTDGGGYVSCEFHYNTRVEYEDM